MDFNIVAVTACVSGVAHTYMAAERLEKVGHHEKWHLKVETQGALGVENRITAEDIARAEVVLLVTDIEIDDPHRFRGLRTIKTSIKSFLLQPQQIVEAVKSIMKKPVVYVELPDRQQALFYIQQPLLRRRQATCRLRREPAPLVLLRRIRTIDI